MSSPVRVYCDCCQEGFTSIGGETECPQCLKDANRVLELQQAISNTWKIYNHQQNEYKKLTGKTYEWFK